MRLLTSYRIANPYIFNRYSSVFVRGEDNCGVDDNFFGLNYKEQKLRHDIYSFCQKEIDPYCEEIDRINKIPNQRNFWRKLGEKGLFGITVPKCYGGLGLSYFSQFITFEEMARSSAAVGLSYGAHSNLCVNQFVLNAKSEQIERFLPKLLTGEHVGALAMSETESGSDVVSMKLRAERHRDYFVLNGNKFWITNGPDADVAIVYARTKTDCLPEHGITTFIVEKGMDGFTTMPKLDKLGMRGSNTGELVFSDCKVPAKNVLGRVNGGIYVLFKGLDIERALLSAGCVGIIQACLDLVLPLVLKDPSELLLDKVARMHTQLAVCRSYTYAVVRAIDNGKIVSKDCAGCALYTSEKATQIALDTIQCLGPGSYGRYHSANRHLRDAKLNEIGGGTNEVRRWLIGRRINEDYAA